MRSVHPTVRLDRHAKCRATFDQWSEPYQVEGTQSLPLSLPNSLTQLTHSFITQSLTPSLAHSLVRSLTHSVIAPLSIAPSITYSHTHLLIHLTPCLTPSLAPSLPHTHSLVGKLYMPVRRVFGAHKKDLLDVLKQKRNLSAAIASHTLNELGAVMTYLEEAAGKTPVGAAAVQSLFHVSWPTSHGHHHPTSDPLARMCRPWNRRKALYQSGLLKRTSGQQR